MRDKQGKKNKNFPINFFFIKKKITAASKQLSQVNSRAGAQ
jgi:hypothetical protein